MRTIVILIALTLAGCASNAVEPATEANARAPLLCADKVQCDLYWQRAQVWISRNSRYRIQSVTDVVISTFGPMRASTDLAFQVTRIPKADGGSQITIGAVCDNSFGCNPHQFKAIASFKYYVQAGE